MRCNILDLNIIFVKIFIAIRAFFQKNVLYLCRTRK